MRAMDLFCCSGGLAHGFRQTGIEFEIAVDFDADACASYAANLGRAPLQIDANVLLAMARAGWTPGPLDLLVADPPCAMWSRAGKRQGLADPRDMLRTTVELIALFRPRAYMIGNIPGLQDSTSWPIVQELIGGLSRVGYCVVDYACLDAADYGVPQHRERPFWYGHLDGPCIVWPARTHGDPRKLGQGVLFGDRLRPWVTCREARGPLALDEIGRPVHLRHEGKRASPRHPHSETDAPARVITDGDGGGQKRRMGFGTINPLHMPSDPDSPARALTAKVRGAQGGQAIRQDDPTARPWGRPATTVHCDPRIAPPGHHDGSFLSPSGDLRRKRDPSTRGPQSSRVGDPSAPARAIDTRIGRVGSGDNAVLAWTWEECESRHVREQPLMGQRIGSASSPGAAVTTKPSRVGAGAGQVLAWPWDQPSTVVCAGLARIAPPGRSGSHGEQQSGHPNAVVLSEKAAAILQGFPMGWTFAGTTKKARWAQIGMAVPPPLAAAIGRSVARARAG